MEDNSEPQSHTHFPEDRDAPHIQNKSFFKRFYEKHKNPVDYVVLGLISLSTLVTVSLSIYIIVVKYF
jgi:hypothetical protein